MKQYQRWNCDEGQHRPHVEVPDHELYGGTCARADGPPFETGQLAAKGPVGCLARCESHTQSGSPEPQTSAKLASAGREIRAPSLISFVGFQEGEGVTRISPDVRSVSVAASNIATSPPSPCPNTIV